VPRLAPENPELTGLVRLKVDHLLQAFVYKGLLVFCKLVTFATFECRRFLAFETEKKAKLFLKEKIDLINDLRKAIMIISFRISSFVLM
jgi:hypothetical protein